jgi:transcriptional regulator with XRE-family HTH domain
MTGGELKEKRNELGLTQVQLAEKLDVKPNTVARWENGVLAVPKVVSLALEALERKPGRPAKASKSGKKASKKKGAKQA